MAEFIVLRQVPRPNPAQCAYPFHAFFVVDEESLLERMGKDIFENDRVYTISKTQHVTKIEVPLKLVDIQDQIT